MLYTDLSTIHNPVTGGIVPSAWGDAVGSNFDFLSVPPSCRFMRSGNHQVIPSGINTVVDLDSERWDTDSVRDSTSGLSRLTCKTAGQYLITAHGEWIGGGSGQIRAMHIWLNRALSIASQQSPPSGTSLRQTPSTFYPLAVNDYIEMLVFHDNGADLTLISANEYTPEISMVWLGR